MTRRKVHRRDPLDGTRPRRLKVRLVIEPDLWDRARQAAIRDGKSFSWWVCELIRVALGGRP